MHCFITYTALAKSDIYRPATGQRQRAFLSPRLGQGISAGDAVGHVDDAEFDAEYYFCDVCATAMLNTAACPNTRRELIVSFEASWLFCSHTAHLFAMAPLSLSPLRGPIIPFRHLPRFLFRVLRVVPREVFIVYALPPHFTY